MVGKNVLVMTDTKLYNGRESIFPLIRELCQCPQIKNVYLTDRGDSTNGSFFYALDPDCSAITVRKCDENFTLDQVRRYKRKPMAIKDFDAVIIKMNHPVTHEFLRYVARKFRGKFVFNKPKGLVHTSTKLFLKSLEDVLGDLMPPVTICRSGNGAEKFMAQHPGGIVLKSWWSHHGNGVVRWRTEGETDFTSKEDVQTFLDQGGPCLMMPFLNPPGGKQSDNRILVLNGKILGAFQRVPGPDSWQCNTAKGGSYSLTEISDREQTLIKKLDPIMRWHGIGLYGVDCLLNDQGERVLSEINTINAGGVNKVEDLTGKPYCKLTAYTIAKMMADNSYAVDVPTFDLMETELAALQGEQKAS